MELSRTFKAWKGAAMNTHIQTRVWVHRFAVVLGTFVVVSLVGIIALTIIGGHIHEVVIVFGLVAMTGMVRLLISPLNRNLF